MIIWNLTDVATAALEERGLVNHTFSVGRAVLEPGASADVPAPNMAAMAPLVQCGALAVGRLPPAYVAAKRVVIQKAVLADEQPLPTRRKTR